MVSRPREEPTSSPAPEVREGLAGGVPPRGVVFMTDPSAEAERAAQALRASAYLVLDVPFALLPSRVAVQRPDVIVVDAEAEGVREVIARLRALPGGQGIDLLFLGALGAEADDLVLEASGVFRRPLDVSHIVRKIQALLPLDASPHDEHLTPPPSLSASLPRGERVPTLPPPALSWASPPAPPGAPERAAALAPPPRRPGGVTSRPPAPNAVRVTTRPPSSRPSPSPPWASSHETLTNPRPPLGPRLSDELRRLLDDAGARLDEAGFEIVPAPEDEVDAVLPPELLEALDEPLEVDETFGETRPAVGTDPGTPVPQTQTGVGPALLPPDSFEEPLPSSTVSSLAPAPFDPAPPPPRPPPASGNEPPAATRRDGGESSDWRRHAVTLRPPRPRSSDGGPDSGAWSTRGRETAAALDDDDELGEALTPRSAVPFASRRGALVPPLAPPAPPAPPAPLAPPPLSSRASLPLPPRVSPPLPPRASPPLSARGAPPLSSRALPPLPPRVSPPLPPRASPPLPPRSRPSPYAPPASPASPGGTPPSGAYAAPPSFGRGPASVGGGRGPASSAGVEAAVPSASRTAPSGVESDRSAGGAPPALESFREGEAARLLGRAVAERRSLTLCFEGDGVLRRMVLRDGDFVSAGSGAEDETLVAFLASLGEIPKAAARRLEGRVPPFGRHAGAALVARGHVVQDRLWAVLRGHAEWIIARVVAMPRGHYGVELEPPRRYQAEPSVFGGSAGAEVFVDVVRRIVAPPDALERLGGPRARLDEGPHAALLGECALSPRERSICEAAAGAGVGELVGQAGGPEFASLLWALALLGVLTPLEAAPAPAAGPASAPHDAIDEQALRERVRARLELVEEGDYFAMLGVPRSATSYDLRRAYLELRRSFEPSRLLTAATADLADPLALIRDVLDEAYDILRDPTRRERYRRAIEGGPPGPR